MLISKTTFAYLFFLFLSRILISTLVDKLINETRVILIGGSSHVDKSTLAQSLTAKLGWNYLSTDNLARHPGRPWVNADGKSIREHVIELANARQTLAESVANYNNPDLLSEASAAGRIRSLECAWAIEQAITLIYQLQNELGAVSDRLIDLQDKIRQECLQVIESCDSQDQLDFLFPEIACICDRDLLVLNIWQQQSEYIDTLPASELELLALPQTNTIENN